MYPGVALKCVVSLAAGGKHPMKKLPAINNLRIGHRIIVICIAILAQRAYKLLVKHGNKVVVHIYILIHTAEQLGHTFVINAICFARLYYFPAAFWLPLEIKIREGFG